VYDSHFIDDEERENYHSGNDHPEESSGNENFEEES